MIRGSGPLISLMSRQNCSPPKESARVPCRETPLSNFRRLLSFQKAPHSVEYVVGDALSNFQRLLSGTVLEDSPPPLSMESWRASAAGRRAMPGRPLRPGALARGSPGHAHRSTFRGAGGGVGGGRAGVVGKAIECPKPSDFWDL